MIRTLLAFATQYVLVGYLLIWNLVEFFLTLVRWRRNISSYQRRNLGIDVPETSASAMPPVSYIVPIHNGQGFGVQRLTDLLSLAYSNCEFIIVNDGSTDGTLESIVSTFRMQKSAYRFRHEIRSARVLAVYTSMEYPSLLLVDKERGGRADSLHVGLNHARFPLVCPLPIGTIPAPDQMRSMLKYFMLEPEAVAAVAGRAVPSTLQGNLLPPQQPPFGKLSTSLAFIESEQLDLGGSRDWNAVLNLLTVPDTVAVLRKDLVMFAGGYRLEAEDPEREFWLRFHCSFRAWNMPRRILFKEDPVGIVVPTDGFVGQLEHYRLDQRHLLKILFEHFKLFLKPAGGIVSFVGLPFVMLFRAALPMVLVLGMVGVPILWLTKVIPGSVMFHVLILALATPIFRSIAGALLESVAGNPTAGLLAHLRHAALATVHRVLFSPLVAVGRTLSLVDIFRKKVTVPLVGTDEDYDLDQAPMEHPPLDRVDVGATPTAEPPVEETPPPADRLPEGLIEQATAAIDQALTEAPQEGKARETTVELPIVDLGNQNAPSDPLDLGTLDPAEIRDEKEETSPILPIVDGVESEPLDLGTVEVDNKPSTEVRLKLPEGVQASSMEEPLDLGGVDRETRNLTAPVSSRSLEPLDPADIKRALEMLAQSSLFYGVIAKDRNRILPFLQTTSLQPGEHALSQGEISPALFLVIQGDLEVFRFDDQGRETPVGYLHGGDSFGEMSMLTGEASPTTVRAKTAARLLAISRDDFPKLTAEVPWLGVTVARLLAERLTRAGAAIVSKLREGVPGRLDLVAPSALIEAIHLNGLSGTLAAQRGEESMIAYFEDGRLCGAQTDRADGEKAFYEFLAWTNGSFSFVPGKREGAVQMIETDMVRMLLEGMRRMKEGRPPEDFAVGAPATPSAADVLDAFSLSDEGSAFLALSRIPLFAGLSSEQMKHIITMMQEHRFAAGEDCIRQGQLGQAVYVVASGIFDVMRKDLAGNVTKMATLQPGQWFNELSMITGEPVPATVTCQKDGSLIEIRRESFRQLLGKVPALGANLARIMAVRLARASRWAEQQSGGEAVGQLDSTPPSDLIQAIHINQQSGTLKVESDGKIIEIDFVDGKIRDARLDDLRGDEAVLVMLAWNKGMFTFRPGKPTSEQSVSSDTMGLLLRGMRRIERARAEAAGTAVRDIDTALKLKAAETPAIAAPPISNDVSFPMASIEDEVELEPIFAGMEDAALDAVSASTLFFGIHARDRQALLPFLRFLKVEVGGEAVRQGRSIPAMFIAFEGTIEVIRPQAPPGSPLARQHTVGGTFNELPFLTAEPAAATVWAVTEARLLAIARSDFSALTVELPWLGVTLARLLAHRLFTETGSLAEDLQAGKIGRLELITPFSILEALHLHRKSGSLVFFGSGHSAVLRLRDGHVVDAKLESMSGDAVVRQALTWRMGSYRFEAETDSEVARTVLMGTIGLLLESARGTPRETPIVLADDLSFTPANEEAALNALGRVPAFSGLKADELREALQLFQERKCTAGEKLVRQGQLGQSEFIVCSGRFDITRRGDDNVELNVGTRGPGDHLDGLSMITGEPETESATCSNDAILLELPRESFKRLLGKIPALVANLARILAGRLARTCKWAGSRSDKRITGNLETLPAVELLQALHHKGVTGTLQIEGRKKTVELDFVDGRIQGARLEDEVGDEALFRLLGMTRGAFTFVPGTPETAPTITSETIALLFRGLRRAERQAGKRETTIQEKDAGVVAEPVVDATPAEPEPSVKVEAATGKELNQALKSLSKNLLFAGLNSREKKQVKPHVGRAEIESDREVLRSDEKSPAFFIVEKGVLEVSRADADKTRTLADLEPGDWFGEMSLLTGEPAAVQVRTKKASKLIAISRDEFPQLLSAAPWVGAVLARLIARRLRDASKGLAGEMSNGDFGRLESVTPAALVEALHLREMSGTLKLARGNKSATLYVQDGQVFEAMTDGAEGEAAFYDFLGWNNGSFRFEPGRKEDAVPTLHRPTVGLLLEGARRKSGSPLPDVQKPTGEAFTKENAEAVRNALGRIPLFAGLRTEELKEVAALLEERSCAAKDEVLKQGRQEEDLLVICSGSYETARRDESRARSRVGILGPGESFGELSLLTGALEGGSLTCTADGKVLALPVPAIFQLMSRIPALVLNVARVLSVRLARAEAWGAKIEGPAEGSLETLPAIELLQALHDSLSTGELMVESRKKIFGVDFANGEITGVRYEKESPEDALGRLLALTKGTFIFSPIAAEPTREEATKTEETAEAESIETDETQVLEKTDAAPIGDTLSLLFQVYRRIDAAVTKAKSIVLKELVEEPPPAPPAPVVVEPPPAPVVEAPVVVEPTPPPVVEPVVEAPAEVPAPPVVVEPPPAPAVEPPAVPAVDVEADLDFGPISDAIDILEEADAQLSMTPLDPDEIKTALEALAQSRLFFGVHARDRYRILPYIRHTRVTAGQEILREKKPGKGLFLLVEGTVDVVQKDEQGDDRMLAHLGVGECFGEMSMLTGEPASATVRATTNSRLIVFTKEDFPKMTLEFPWLGVTLARLIAQRLTRTSVAIVKELRKGLVGRLELIPIAAVVQAVNVNQQTGTLHVGREPLVATAYFREGQLFAIRLEDRSANRVVEGEEGFYELLTWVEGSFRFEPEVKDDVVRQVATDTVGLLLEGSRRIDEQRIKGGTKVVSETKSRPRPSRAKMEPFTLQDEAASRTALSRIPIFSGLRDEQLHEVLAMMQEKRTSPGDVIIGQDQLGQALYVIAAGEFEVNQRDEAGAENKLATLGPGDCFGELSLLTGQPTSSTVACTKDGALVLIPREQFMQLLGRVPSLGASLARILAARLANASKWIADQTEGGFVGRLETMPPAELVQAINVNQQSGTLNVRGGNRQIEVIFVNGQVMDAVSGDLRGEEAFFALLEMRRGTFTFKPGSPTASKTIDSDTIGLLFRGMRRAERAANAGVDLQVARTSPPTEGAVDPLNFDSRTWEAPPARELLQPDAQEVPPAAVTPVPAPAPVVDEHAPPPAIDEGLRRCLLFAGVSDEVRRMAAGLAELKWPDLGTEVVGAASHRRELIVVIDGSIEVVREDAQHRLVPVSTLGPGEVWGVRTLLCGQPSSYTARAHRGLGIVMLPIGTVAPLFEQSSTLAINASRILASRMARAGALVLQGKLDQVRPSEVLEAMHLLGMTGVLKVKNDAQQFEAVFEAGQIVSATLGKMTGPEVLGEILKWPTGASQWKPGSVRVHHNIERPTSDLLLHIGQLAQAGQELGTITSDLGLAVEGLRKSPIFQGLHADELAEGLDAMRILEIENAETLMTAGQESKAIYAVQEGAVHRSTGEKLGPGHHFGGFTTITGHRENSTIKSDGPTRLLVFSKDDLGAFMAKVPAFGVTLARELARRILDSARWMHAEANRAKNAVTEDHPFATAIEAAHALRVTGTLNLRKGESAATAFLEWGEVTHLSSPGGQGKTLMPELVGWTGSTIEWVPGPAPFNRNVTANTRWLIYDALAGTTRKA